MSETPWAAAGEASRALGAYVTSRPEMSSGLLVLRRTHLFLSASGAFSPECATSILSISVFVILNATASCWFYGNTLFYLLL